MTNKLTKTLLVIDHAPDYREAFLRELGKKVDLTVVAQPCEPDSLNPPKARNNYKYIEIPTIRFMGLIWQPNLKQLLKQHKWEVVCFDFNLRHISRLYLFLFNPNYWKIWVWRGLIFGSKKNKIINLLRKYFLKRSANNLVYSDIVVKKLKEMFGVNAVSFNNSEVRTEEFRKATFNNYDNELRMIFVGTFKLRKKLDRLIKIIQRRKDIKIRIIGSGMENLYIPSELQNSSQIQIFGHTFGKELNLHFDWADIVISPGNVGLLVMNAARHGKGIVIDNKSYHGPEYWLAKESGQPFISFENEEIVDKFIDDVIKHRWKLKKWGEDLQSIAKEKYTVEFMAETHFKVYRSISEN